MYEKTVDMKEIVIKDIMKSIRHHATIDQMQIIEVSIRKSLEDFDIVSKSTELAVFHDNNINMIDGFLISKKLEGKKDSSMSQYRCVLIRFFREINKNYYDITKNDIKLWFASKYKTMHRNTLVGNKRVLDVFFKWLENEGYIPSSPMKAIQTMKELPTETIYFTMEEEMLIRDYICKDNISIKHKAIISLLLSTGIRVGEIANMNRNDVDFIHSSITFRGEKSDNIRTVFMDVRAKYYLSEYLKTRTDNNPALFVTIRSYNGCPKRLRKSRFENIAKRIGHDAGIANKNCTVHVFRRTFATRLANQGCPLEVIQSLLGHVNVNTTSKHYVAKSDQRTRSTISRYLDIT